MDNTPTATNSNARKFTKGALRLMLTAAAGGIKDAPRRRRIIHELCWRPHRSRRKIAAAVRAHAVETGLDAIAAEGALERADHRGGGRWGRSISQHSQLGRSSSISDGFLGISSGLLSITICHGT